MAADPSGDVEAVQREPRRWLILAVLCLSLLVVVIDNTVLNVAIPTLTEDLHADSADIQWILDAYIVVFAGLLLTAGSLSDRHGRRRGLVIGLAVFGAASLAAAVSQNPGQLIAARAVMGVGGAFLMPGTLSIITTVFDDAERKKAIAIWGSVLMAGAVAGPTCGGFLLEHFWWGSVFLINVPVAIVGIVAALAIIPESRGPARRPDLVGALLSMVGMTSLVWGFIEGAKDGWSDPRVVSAFVLAAVGLSVFVIWERRSSEPMLPLELFAERNFSGASLSVVLLSLASAGTLLALTQYLQFVLGYGPMRAGLALTPLIVAGIVFNGLGVLVDKRFGARVAVAAGLLLLGAGFGVIATIDSADGYGTLAVALAVIGAGSGTAGPAAYGTLLSSLPKDRAGVGSAVNDTVQQVGQALGVAVLGSILTGTFSSSLPADVTGPARDSVGSALAVARSTGDARLVRAAEDAFLDGLSVTATVGLVAGIVAAAVAFVVLRPGPAHSEDDDIESEKGDLARTS